MYKTNNPQDTLSKPIVSCQFYRWEKYEATCNDQLTIVDKPKSWYSCLRMCDLQGFCHISFPFCGESCDELQSWDDTEEEEEREIDFVPYSQGRGHLPDAEAHCLIHK